MQFPFPNKVSQESSHTFEQKVIVSQYGDGVQQRAAVGINNRYDKWSVQINFLTEAERTTMVSFFNTHGLVQSFDWTPPGGTATKWVFSSPMTESNVGTYYNYSFELLQIFE